MRRLPSVLRFLVTAAAIAIGVEGGYRLFLLFKYPERFRTTAIDAAEFSVWSASPWRYDPVYGYGYVPSLIVDNVHLKGGIVKGCGQFGIANEQGNLGPPVRDFADADFRVVVFGDSFAGAYATGPAWTKMLGEKLQASLGRTVSVLNMARDGYGMPQIVALANGKLKELRPSLVIIAFNGPSLERARYWRTTVGAGDDIRLYSSVENSPNPDPETAADTAIVMASPTRGWCEQQVKKSPQEQRRDPILEKILIKHRAIEIKNRTPQANLFDLKASYVYDMVRYRNGFRSQWRSVLPSTNPQVTYDDYRDDPKFMADLAGVMNSGVPYLFAHIALGKSISEGREFDLDNRSRNLMDSLRSITGAEIYKTTDFVLLSREEALNMCSSPSDCHPSEFGHKVYADAVSKMVLKSGIR
jgi:hypothetical protein